MQERLSCLAQEFLGWGEDKPPSSHLIAYLPHVAKYRRKLGVGVGLLNQQISERNLCQVSAEEPERDRQNPHQRLLHQKTSGYPCWQLRRELPKNF